MKHGINTDLRPGESHFLCSHWRCVVGRAPKAFRGCVWPPAKGVCDLGVTLELSVRSRRRTIRRDAEWRDRDGDAPKERGARAPRPHRSASRRPNLRARLEQVCRWNLLRARPKLLRGTHSRATGTVALPKSKAVFRVWNGPRSIGAWQRTTQKIRRGLGKLRRLELRAHLVRRERKPLLRRLIFPRLRARQRINREPLRL